MSNIVKRWLAGFQNQQISHGNNFKQAIKIIIGFKPGNLHLYELAMLHASIANNSPIGKRSSNERLEYLGDAVLGMVVAEYLFNKFPYKDEGFLTEIRSRIVNREALNRVSHKIGLNSLVKFQLNNRATVPKSIFGDSLEALIGAIYLDKGFKKAKKFIIEKILLPHYDLSELTSTDSNFKSKIIEYAQRENKSIYFDVSEVNNDSKGKHFTATLYLDEVEMEMGHGFSKKKAEQDAARKTLERINQTEKSQDEA